MYMYTNVHVYTCISICRLNCIHVCIKLDLVESEKFSA